MDINRVLWERRVRYLRQLPWEEVGMERIVRGQ